MTRRLLATVPLLVVAGCAGEAASYPSLAPRAVEKQGFAEPEAAVAKAAPDPALDARVAELGTRLDAIVKAFTAAASDAERRSQAARGRLAGSEPWLDAQTALASLDDRRAQASALATDVEQLAIARAVTLAPPYAALTGLGERADDEAKREAETIARLEAMLAPA